MKAILFTNEGFRKDIIVDKKVPYYRLPVYSHIDIKLASSLDIQKPLPYLEYVFERSFINEYNEEILIYREI